jgi:K+-sensing histidine kinase KdpD
MPEGDASFTAPLWAMLPLGVAPLLVSVRGVASSELIAFGVALTVVIAGRFGGSAAGSLGGVMAATSYNFFFTRPYLLLKFPSLRYAGTVSILVLVGFTVGELSSRIVDSARRASDERTDTAGLARVLSIAAEGRADDVERAIRTELRAMLALDECWFTSEAPDLVAVEQDGAVRCTERARLSGDLFLPPAGVALPVTCNGRRYGCLVAVPIPDVAVTAQQRRIAVAMAGALGLAMAAESGPLTRS